MPVQSDYLSGTISLTNGSVDFTGTSTGWLLAGFKEGDTIIDITGATEFMGVIATIDANGAGTLTKAWEGPTLVDVAYRMRYQPDGARVSAQARNLIELLGNGNVLALAGLSGSANQVPMFTGPGAMTLVPKTDLVSGVAYDVQVDLLADRDAYDGQAEGFSVLVANVGDGRAAVYAKASATSGDWTDPAYVTGPIGPLPDVTVGTVTTGDPGTDAEVTATPTVDGVELDFTIPRGNTGDISGVTPFWQGRITADADAAAARAGLELVKQTSATDATLGRLMTVGAFGLGGTQNLVSPDLSQTRPTGVYYCNSPTNGPSGTANGWLVVRDLIPTYAYHQFTDLNGVLWDNYLNDGTWRGWRRLTVEYGSNANGQYIRLGDGTQICSGAVSATLAIETAFLGGYRSSDANATFPATFSTTTGLRAIANQTGNTAFSAIAVPISTSQIACAFYSVSSAASGTRTLSYIAIGRWF